MREKKLLKILTVFQKMVCIRPWFYCIITTKIHVHTLLVNLYFCNGETLKPALRLAMMQQHKASLKVVLQLRVAI